MLNCPAARLREWLFWHLALGVHLIFLRWEGGMSSDQEAAIAGPQSRGQLLLTRQSRRLSSAFSLVMSRQITFVHEAIASARARGCDFLLHLDDDELLFPESPGASIPELLRPYVGSTKRCIHFENLEAVYPFARTSSRPLSRPQTRFRVVKERFALYCNGKSSANLTCRGPVFASGVHHFCQFDRSYQPASEEFGLHDGGGGCTDPECCVAAPAYVLHFECPCFEDYRAKFRKIALNRLTEADESEADIFPYKAASVALFREAEPSRPRQERLYRKWRCVPVQADDAFHGTCTGLAVEARFQELLRLARSRELGDGAR